MTDDHVHAWPARMAHLAEATAFVESFCAAHGLARADALRLSLVIEELFTNTVMHGHGGDCDAPVRIALAAAPGRVELVYDDGAPAFDPVEHHARTADELDLDAEVRPTGRVGIALVMHMATHASYLRDGDRNRLALTIACGSASAG